MIIICNNLNSRNPGFFVPSLVEIAKWLWWRRFLITSNLFSLFCYFFPPWKGRSPSFKITLIPVTQEYYVQSLVENGLVVLEKKINVKNIDSRRDDGQKAIKKANLSFRLGWANNYMYCPFRKGVVFHFEHTWAPTRKDALCLFCTCLGKWMCLKG